MWEYPAGEHAHRKGKLPSGVEQSTQLYKDTQPKASRSKDTSYPKWQYLGKLMWARNDPVLVVERTSIWSKRR